MYVWNHYGKCSSVVAVVSSTVVSVVVRLNIHGTWFTVGVVFALKLLL